jgi:uncharacterized protein
MYSPERAPSPFLLDTVMLQPTSLCNLDCAYCYLLNRDKNRAMPVAVAQQVAAFLELVPQTGRPFEVVWHCGEPLAAGYQALEALFAPFADLQRAGRILHRVQTNATLIDERWCDFFHRHSVSVGVSVDGPAWANGERVDWRGAPAFERIMRGVAALKAAGLEFSALAVIAEEEMDEPVALYRFFVALGCQALGLNVEDRGPANRHRRLLDETDRARNFWSGLAREFLAAPSLRIREFEAFAQYWDRHEDKDPRRRPERAAMVRTRLCPTVGYDGSVVFLAPEFLDGPAGQYESFVVGNILEEPLARIAGRAKRVRYVTDHAAGIEACRAQCGHFAFCRGGLAESKFFSCGTIAAAETAFCRMSRQSLFDALAAVMQTFPQGTAARSVLQPR